MVSVVNLNQRVLYSTISGLGGLTYIDKVRADYMWHRIKSEFDVNLVFFRVRLMGERKSWKRVTLKLFQSSQIGKTMLYLWYTHTCIIYCYTCMYIK